MQRTSNLVLGFVLSLSAFAVEANAQQGYPIGGGQAKVSLDQALKLTQKATAAEKRLDKLPAAFSRTTLSISGTEAAPALMAGGAPIIATKATVPAPIPGKATLPGKSGLLAPASSPTSITTASVGAIGAQNYGAGNQNTIYHYTDHLVEPQSSLSYPNSAIGYFLFTFDNSSWFYCTATMISRSIAVMAGHCVHQGNNSSSGWIKQGIFVPACWNCNTANPYAAFGIAYAAYATTTSGWFATGGLDQGFDVALVTLLNRQGVSPSVEVGDATGWLGFCTGNCLQGNWYLTQRGYPHNYFGGNWAFEGQHHEQSDSRDFVYGSGAEGGSSGGPHISNIEIPNPPANYDSSANLGQFTLRNIVFAVTSWGYLDASIKIQGSSSLTGPSNGNNFTTMFNQACTQAQALHGSGSCTLF